MDKASRMQNGGTNFCFVEKIIPVGSMGLVYLPTFTVQINMQLNIACMDPMGL